MLPKYLFSFQTAVCLFLIGTSFITVGSYLLSSSFFVPTQVEFIASNYQSNVLSDQKIAGEFGISLNDATSVELETLPLVGPTTAKKIIQGRPYRTIDELVSRKIVTERVFTAIREKIIP